MRKDGIDYFQRPALSALFNERQTMLSEDMNLYQAVEHHAANLHSSIGMMGEHDAAHIILGLALLKMGRNPTPMPYAYNLHLYAESITLQIFGDIDEFRVGRSDTIADTSLARESFLKGVADYNKNYFKYVPIDYAEAWRKAAMADEPVTALEVHLDSELNKKYSIENAENMPLPGAGEKNKHGEVFPDFKPMSEEDMVEIFDHIKPAVDFVTSEFVKAKGGRNIDVPDRAAFINDVLRSIKVRDVWNKIPVMSMIPQPPKDAVKPVV